MRGKGVCAVKGVCAAAFAAARAAQCATGQPSVQRTQQTAQPQYPPTHGATQYAHAHGATRACMQDEEDVLKSGNDFYTEAEVLEVRSSGYLFRDSGCLISEYNVCNFGRRTVFGRTVFYRGRGAHTAGGIRTPLAVMATLIRRL